MFKQLSQTSRFQEVNEMIKDNLKKLKQRSLDKEVLNIHKRQMDSITNSILGKPDSLVEQEEEAMMLDSGEKAHYEDIAKHYE